MTENTTESIVSHSNIVIDENKNVTTTEQISFESIYKNTE